MRLSVELLTAEDEPPRKDPSVQKGYRAFQTILDDAGVKSSQRTMFLDGCGALGYPLGAFILDFTTAVVPVLQVAVAGWFVTRKGRKVRLKLDGVEFEANTVEELARLVEIYKSMRDGRPNDGDAKRNSVDPDTRRE